MSDIPAITGKELIRLLVKDGWKKVRNMNHGVGLIKHCPELDRHLVTCVPNKNRPLSKSTLGQILSDHQSMLGKAGLKKLIEKYR